MDMVGITWMILETSCRVVGILNTGQSTTAVVVSSSISEDFLKSKYLVEHLPSYPTLPTSAALQV